MTKPTDPYSRVYWRIVDDERFERIYADDHHLAAWLRLLLGADQSWPASAPLPSAVRRSSVTALVSCGLVELRQPGFYRVHGLDAERGRRASTASVAADARWRPSNADGMRPHPPSNADGMQSHPVSNAKGMLDETRLDETRLDETESSASSALVPLDGEGGPGGDDDRDCLDTYHELTMWRPWGQYSGDALKGATASFGDVTVSTALRAEWTADKARDTLLKRTLTRLARDADRQRDVARTKPRTRKQDNAELMAESRKLAAEMMAAEMPALKASAP